ncbi:MAG: thioredoxin family protein [Synoicihabitans sp.]
MKEKVTFYHAGCPVCVEAQATIESIIDRNRFDLEIVHLGEASDRLPEAEEAGLKSVPALHAAETMVHLNFGADVAALKS